MIKKTTLTIVLLLFTGLFAISQDYRKPSKGKSLIYFVRTPGMGPLVNFKFFDGEKYLGKMKGVNYFTYECEPGNHLFWVSSENRDFIQGKLEANATYILVTKPQAGAMKTRVKIEQVFPENAKLIKKVNKVLSKRSEYKLKGQKSDVSYLIKNSMKRFQKIKHKAKKIHPMKHF